MTQSIPFPVYAESIHYDLKELLVAYDFSEAADASLKYAVMLSKRFGSFIHLIGVQSPADCASALDAGPFAMRRGNQAIDCADGVVSATIREAHCPVMTVPSNFSG